MKDPEDFRDLVNDCARAYVMISIDETGNTDVECNIDGDDDIIRVLAGAIMVVAAGDVPWVKR